MNYSEKANTKPVDFEDARSLVQSAENRDAGLRSFVASMRNMYRTGRLDTTLTVHSLDRYLWERDDFRSHLEALNLACSYINIIVASTASRLPFITAEPSYITPDTQQAADGVAALVRGFLEEDDTIAVARRCGLDASISGDGFVHVQWELDIHTLSEQEYEDAKQAAIAEYASLALAAGDDPTPPAELLESIPTEKVVTNRPTAHYVSPIDVFLPSHISDVHETPWYAIRSIMRVEDVKNNPAYDKEARDQVGAESQSLDDAARRLDIINANTYSTSQSEVCTVYTFYDCLAHRIVVFTNNGGKPLYDGENPNDFKDRCLVHLRAYRDGEQLRGFGDLELIAGLLDKLNFVLRQQLENLERQGTVYVTREDVFSDEDRAALETARPGDVITAHGISDGVRLADVIEAFPVTALSNDVYTAREQLQQDIVKVLGLSEFQTGSLGPSRMSGTAAAVADGVATLRAQARLEAYEVFYARIANLFWKLCRQHLTEDQVVKIIGPDGSLFQETVSLEEMSMDFFIRVKTGSMAAVNPATRAARGAEMMNLADRLEASGYDADSLRRYALREMGVDPELMGVRRMPPPQPAAAPTMPGMPEMPVAPGSPQADMMMMGAPPTPGVEGNYAM